jgi:hypothetical protein
MELIKIINIKLNTATLKQNIFKQIVDAKANDK